MVEASYLPYNYELTSTLQELKDHYVTVNHCLHALPLYTVQKGATCSHRGLCTILHHAKKFKRKSVKLGHTAQSRIYILKFLHQNIKLRLFIRPEPAERIKRC